MYDAGIAYLKLETLLQLLAQCPAESTIWINPMGNLSIVDHTGKYLGYIDCAWNEDIVWHEPRVDKDPTQSFFG